MTDEPALRFVRPRRVEGVEDYDDPRPWLAHLTLAPSERDQLLHVIRLLDPELDDATILGGAFRAFERANGVAEVPLEWWDVEDANGQVRYQLWLYCADGGQLFDASTTTSVGYVSQCAFWPVDDAQTALGPQLAAAQAAVSSSAPASELVRVAFVPR